MKNVFEFIQHMTNADLREACKELQEFHSTGILSDGKVREVSKMISDAIGGISVASHLSLAESYIKLEAMRRFVVLTETLKINA